jgi:flagellin
MIMAISLSQGMRNAVYSLGDINDAIAVSNKRLATGKKVNSALDNAGAFFRAQGLNKDARDLGGLLDGMERGQKIISKAASALNGMIKLVESAQALSRQAVQLGETDANRNVLQTQVFGLLNQMNTLAQDATYDGKNILSTGTTLQTSEVIATNVSATTNITLTTQNMRLGFATGLNAAFTAAATGISITAAANTETYGSAAVWNNAAGTALLNTTITQFNTVLTGLQTAASNVATQSAVLDIRKSFTKDAQRANNEFADYLTLADINEEGAALTALQTKQSLAVTSLSLAGRADQAILRLF